MTELLATLIQLKPNLGIVTTPDTSFFLTTSFCPTFILQTLFC